MMNFCYFNDYGKEGRKMKEKLQNACIRKGRPKKFAAARCKIVRFYRSESLSELWECLTTWLVRAKRAMTLGMTMS